jgi:hypothetical protein
MALPALRQPTSSVCCPAITSVNFRHVWLPLLFCKRQTSQLAQHPWLPVESALAHSVMPHYWGSIPSISLHQDCPRTPGPAPQHCANPGIRVGLLGFRGPALQPSWYALAAPGLPKYWKGLYFSLVKASKLHICSAPLFLSRSYVHSLR